MRNPALTERPPATAVAVGGRRWSLPAMILALLGSLASAAEQPVVKPAEPTPAAKPAEAAPAAKPAEVAPAAKPAEATPATAEAKPGAKPAEPAAEAKPADGPPPPTEEQLASIKWEEFAADNTWVCPFARDFSHNDEFPERKKDWEDFLAKFAVWAPGHVFDTTEKVRNLIGAAALMDIGQGQFEAELPLFVYQRLRREVPDDKLKAILGFMAFHPDQGTIIATAPELNLEIGVGEDQVRERLQILAIKMLGRVLGKLPMDSP